MCAIWKILWIRISIFQLRKKESRMSSNLQLKLEKSSSVGRSRIMSLSTSNVQQLPGEVRLISPGLHSSLGGRSQSSQLRNECLQIRVHLKNSSITGRPQQPRLDLAMRAQLTSQLPDARIGLQRLESLRIQVTRVESMEEGTDLTRPELDSSKTFQKSLLWIPVG